MRTKLLILLVSILALVMVTSAIGAPRLTLPESSFDFGFVPQNAKVSHVFWLHSTGDDTLKILKVIPG